MFTATLASKLHWQMFLLHPIWLDSLAWIAANAASCAEGVYELGQPGWFVNVHGYETKPEKECQWENHRHTIDLQYLIAGREGIRVRAVEFLGVPALFKAESDTQKFLVSEEEGHFLDLRAGDFAIFLPGEAHCPKIAIGGADSLRKLVVKIPVSLLERPQNRAA